MTDVADLCERAKVWLESNSVCPDWVSEQRKLVQWVREVAAALPRLSAERDEARIAKLEIAIDAAAATEEALYNRIVAERARAEKAETLAGQLHADLYGMQDGALLRDTRAALAAEQAQVFAALQERDDLAVALAEARRELDEADRDCSLIIGWAAAADGEPDVMLTEFHALRHRIAELEGEVVRVDSGWTESRASAADAGMALRTAAAAAAAIDCDHSAYILELDGRCCPRCGVTMVDPGD